MSATHPEDGPRVLSLPQSLRVFGAHLVDPGVSIVAVGPWTGELGVHFDVMRTLEREYKRKGVKAGMPYLASPAESPPAEDPDLFWFALMAVESAVADARRLKVILRRMGGLSCLNAFSKVPTPCGRDLSKRFIALYTRRERTVHRTRHALLCMSQLSEIVQNMYSVGREFQEEPKGSKEV